MSTFANSEDYTICYKAKKDLQTKEYILKKKIIEPDTPRYVQWTIPMLLYWTSRKNPLEKAELNGYQ